MKSDRIRLTAAASGAGAANTTFVLALAAFVAAGCAGTSASDPACCAPGGGSAAGSGPAVAAASVAGAAAVQSAVPKWSDVKLTSETWHVEGCVADACQCIVFCPCEFQSLPSEGNCDDTALIHIDKGNFGGVPLDGVDIVVASSSPKGKRMIDNVGNLTFGRIYVGSTASDAQAAVAAEVARRMLGTWVKDQNRISPDERTTKVELHATMAAEKATAKIPGVLDLAMETLKGGDQQGPILVKNSPWSAPGIGDVRIAHSTVYDYTTEGRAWHYGGRSASFRSFTMEGKTAPN
jgi:hypothetical protein